MVIERLPDTPASRARRPRNVWPFIIAAMTVIGALGGRFLAQH